MGLFGFGKKKREREEAEAKAENREDEAAVDTEETAAPTDVADTYEGRGESYGPWDVDDENVPDYDEYLDMGSCYLPYLAGLQLRIKANRSTQEILGATISYRASSLEIEAFAAPKTIGLWDDVQRRFARGQREGIRTRGRVRHRTPPAGHRQGRQDCEHAHRRRGWPALDAARHLLRQGRER